MKNKEFQKSLIVEIDNLKRLDNELNFFKN